MAFQATRHQRAIGFVLIALVTVAGLFFWWWFATRDMRSLRAMPETERRGLYLRTLENLKTVCYPAPPRSLRELCKAQAELALELPECSPECAELARRYLDLPTR